MIKLYHSNIENFGDWTNPYLIEELTGKKVLYTNKRQANLCGVGSLLTQFTRKRFLDSIKNGFAPEINVWTTGFIKEVPYKETFRRRKINFLALRGELSKARVEKIIGTQLDIPLGDGGLLFSTLLKKSPPKKYSLGRIPHVIDFKNSIFNAIQDKHKHSKIIN